MATANPDFVVGVVCRGHLSDSPGIIHMTPGHTPFSLATFWPIMAKNSQKI